MGRKKENDLVMIRESQEEEKVPEPNPRRTYKNLKFHEMARKSNTHENLFFNNRLV